MTRQTKTPRQRAEEDLAVANRKVIRLDREIDKLTAALVVARRAQTEAIALRDHAQSHPALQTPSTTPTTEENKA